MNGTKVVTRLGFGPWQARPWAPPLDPAKGTALRTLKPYERIPKAQPLARIEGSDAEGIASPEMGAAPPGLACYMPNPIP
jgi:hypothetical protein